MKTSITRRGLIAGLSITAVALTQEAPRPPAAPTREDDLKDARERMSSNAAKLATVKVPMAIEPSFVFKA